LTFHNFCGPAIGKYSGPPGEEATSSKSDWFKIIIEAVLPLWWLLFHTVIPDNAKKVFLPFSLARRILKEAFM
jgi:hypothetical protein